MLSATGQIVSIHEAAPATVDTTQALVPRLGYESTVPRGGATERNQGGQYPTGDRLSFLREAVGAYSACPWLAAPIDVTARTVTAGGVIVEPDDATAAADTTLADAPPQVQKLAKLIEWVNAAEDMVQLMRGVSSDLDVLGDSFTEVVWALGEPVALYSLDGSTMSVLADEHGNVTGYAQIVDGHPDVVHFEPHEVIHVSEDSPQGRLYGMGLIQKAFWPATTYLFAAGLLKERMRKGDPPDLHVDAPIEQSDADFRRWQQQYRTRNLGAANIGNPITTKGGFAISSIANHGKEDLLKVMLSQRDIIISLSGVPPHQVGVIESGNLGGGTGTSQRKDYELNRVRPRAALIMEKFNSHLLRAFGIDGWHLAFGAVDYRDDKALEDIRDTRIKSGLWSLNEARKDINLPPVDGGDDHIVVERSWVMDWQHMKEFARSWIDKNAPGMEPFPGMTAWVPPTHLVPNPDDPDATPQLPASPPAVDPADPPDAKPAEAAPSWREQIVEHYRREVEAASR